MSSKSRYWQEKAAEAERRQQQEREALKSVMRGMPGVSAVPSAEVRTVDPNQIAAAHAQAMTAETGAAAVSIIAAGEHRAVGVSSPGPTQMVPPQAIALLLDTALRILHSTAPQAGQQPKLILADQPPGAQ